MRIGNDLAINSNHDEFLFDFLFLSNFRLFLVLFTSTISKIFHYKLAVRQWQKLLETEFPNGLNLSNVVKFCSTTRFLYIETAPSSYKYVEFYQETGVHGRLSGFLGFIRWPTVDRRLIDHRSPFWIIVRE